jgi:hypothetical protein
MAGLRLGVAVAISLAQTAAHAADGDKLNTPTSHYLIADNIIESDA